jgi:3-oxoacyl-[acyl-carrier-protein] synthase II
MANLNHRDKNGSLEQRVVITGIGFITPIGEDKKTLWENVSNGTSGARLITRFDTSNFRIKIAATIENFDTHRYLSRRDLDWLDLNTQYGIYAAYQAFSDAKLASGFFKPERAGVFWGTGYGGVGTMCKEFTHFQEKGRVWPYFVPAAMSNAVSFEIAKRLAMYGSNLTFTTACSSSNHAIGTAYQNIKNGQIDLAVAGGSDAEIVPFILQGWSELRGAMTTQNDNPSNACKPFSKNRDGMLLGEGSGVLICEELEHAQRRGVPIYGEIIGYGTSCDAHHVTSPDADGQSAAIKAALKDASLSPIAIDYINAHGTATRANDKIETEAIKKVFGAHARDVPVNSSKPLLGHMMGASGAVELIIGLLSMEHNTVHPTINYEVFDEECDLDYVTKGARTKSLNIFMSNSFAFGGSNAVLVVKRFKE